MAPTSWMVTLYLPRDVPERSGRKKVTHAVLSTVFFVQAFHCFAPEEDGLWRGVNEREEGVARELVYFPYMPSR